MNHCRDCGAVLELIRVLPGPRCADCWQAAVNRSAHKAGLPQHPDLTGQADEIVDAIFDRILRDEGKWQIVDAAEAAHKRDQTPTPFDVHAFAATMGLHVLGGTP